MRWVAFLRGINVGGRRITGDRLASAFTSLGFTDVSTFLASGNVLFVGADPEPGTIEEMLNQDLGYPVPVVLRSGLDVQALASANRFSEGELAATERRVQVMLLRDAFGPDVLGAAIEGVPGPDLLRAEGRDLFWLPRTGVSGSDLDIAALERRLGTITVRAHNTLVRLASRL